MNYARAEDDLFRYEGEEAPTPSPAPKPVKAKPPKPQKVIAKPGPLGLHVSSIAKAAHEWPMAKGSTQQFLAHLTDYPGTGFVKDPPRHPPEPGQKKGLPKEGWTQLPGGTWTGGEGEAHHKNFHAFLEGKPNLTKEEILQHLQGKHHDLDEVDLKDRTAYRVVGDDGSTNETYDTEEEAQEAVDQANQEAEDYYRDQFRIKTEPTDDKHVIDTEKLGDYLDNRAAKWSIVTDENGKFKPQAPADDPLSSRNATMQSFDTKEEAVAAVQSHLQKLLRHVEEEHDRHESAQDEVERFIEDHLPGLTDEERNQLVQEVISEQPGEEKWVVNGGHRSRYNNDFDQHYDSEEEAQAAIDEHVRNHYEPSYSYYEDESPRDIDDYEEYSVGGPKENYQEVHVTVPKMPRGYRSSQWGDGHPNYKGVKNPVVRLRHDDRVTTDGKRMMFLEEIQGPQKDEQEKMPSWLKGRIYDVGLKRALYKAAEGNYDRLGWTTGNQQFQHYDIRRVADKLTWEPNGENETQGKLTAYKDGKHVRDYRMDASKLPEYIGEGAAKELLRSEKVTKPLEFRDVRRQSSFVVYDDDGSYKEVFPYASEDNPIPAQTREEAERKAKELSEKGTKTHHTLEGDALAIGGHGIENLYDRDIPRRVEKLVKKMGGKVETSRIEAADYEPIRVGPNAWFLKDGKGDEAEESYASKEEAQAAAKEMNEQIVHSITITPEMREAILKEGFTLYRRSGQPLRFDRGESFLQLLRRLPPDAQEIFATGLLAVLKVRPELRREIGVNDLAYLQSLTNRYARDPADVFAYDRLDDIQAAAADVFATPSEAQKKAGNYKKGHVWWKGLDITIETARGQVRKGKGWEVTMKDNYGYIKRTLSMADGDHVDVFLCEDHPDSDLVFCVNQIKPNGKFDEHKFVLGQTNLKDAKAAYLRNYSPGWKCGTIVPMTIAQFRRWLEDADTGEEVEPGKYD